MGLHQAMWDAVQRIRAGQAKDGKPPPSAGTKKMPPGPPKDTKKK